MGTQLFPTLVGLGWSVTRSTNLKTRKPQSISGKVTAIADWSYPIYTWQLTFTVLRQGNIAGTVYSDLATLRGFYESLLGGFDTFLYKDTLDNSVTNQAIGLGDGQTTSFQLVRSLGGSTSPIFAPNAVTQVKIGGNTISPGAYTVGSWGGASPGVITFNSPPPAGQTIFVTYTYYFPCRFKEDTTTFEEFASGFLNNKKMTFDSVKY